MKKIKRRHSVAPDNTSTCSDVIGGTRSCDIDYLELMVTARLYGPYRAVDGRALTHDSDRLTSLRANKIDHFIYITS